MVGVTSCLRARLEAETGAILDTGNRTNTFCGGQERLSCASGSCEALAAILVPGKAAILFRDRPCGHVS